MQKAFGKKLNLPMQHIRTLWSWVEDYAWERDSKNGKAYFGSV